MWLFWNNADPLLGAAVCLVPAAAALMAAVYYRRQLTLPGQRGIYLLCVAGTLQGLHQLAIHYNWSCGSALNNASGVVFLLGCLMAFWNVHLYGSPEQRTMLKERLFLIAIGIAIIFLLGTLGRFIK